MASDIRVTVEERPDGWKVSARWGAGSMFRMASRNVAEYREAFGLAEVWGAWIVEGKGSLVVDQAKNSREGEL